MTKHKLHAIGRSETNLFNMITIVKRMITNFEQGRARSLVKYQIQRAGFIYSG